MTAAKVRLLLAAILFASWIGYLACLALPETTSRQVLSRAQFLVATVDVVAQLEAADGQLSPHIKVEQVLWPDSEQPLTGKVLQVINLGSTRVPESSDVSKWAAPAPGWYILPLVKRGEVYEVAAVPHSPGFEFPRGQDCRVYSDTPANRRQVASIRER